MCYSKIIHEHPSWDIKGDQVKGESGITQSIIVELHALFKKRDQMESECCVTRSIIDELRFMDIQRDQMEA